MPRFIDYHPSLPPISPEMAQQMAERLKEGQPDQFGVKGINAFISNKGQGWCLTEAPDAESVVKSHEALGLSVDSHEVHEVQTIP